MGNIHWIDIFTCTDFADLYISNTCVLCNVHISWHKYQYFQCTQAFQHSPCLGLLQLWQQPLLCHLLHGYWNPGWCGLQVITHIFIFHIISIHKNCHNLHGYWNPDANKYFLSSYNNLSYRQVQTIQKFSSGPAYSFTEGEADVTAVPGINNVIFWSTMSSYDKKWMQFSDLKASHACIFLSWQCPQYFVWTCPLSIIEQNKFSFDISSSITLPCPEQTNHFSI